MKAGAALWLLAAALGVAGCDDNTRGHSTPAAMEAPGRSASPAGAPVTPAAGDTPAGGSSGHKGMPPVPDSSGGPSTGGSASGAPGGAAPSRPAPGATSTPEPAGPSRRAGDFTDKPGLPAQDTGRTATQGSSNSTPNSSTGNASR